MIVAIFSLVQIILFSPLCPAAEQQSIPTSDNEKALLDYIRQTKEAIKKECQENIEATREKERLEREAKNQAERKKRTQ